jgi:hypothetical protein
VGIYEGGTETLKNFPSSTLVRWCKRARISIALEEQRGRVRASIPTISTTGSGHFVRGENERYELWKLESECMRERLVKIIDAWRKMPHTLSNIEVGPPGSSRTVSALGSSA